MGERGGVRGHPTDKEGPEGVKWELGFAHFDWDLPVFSLGKWDLGHWDWDSETKNGNGKPVST